MRLKTLAFPVLVFVILSTMTTSALACACCAERGVYEVYTGVPQPGTLELLKDMRLGPSAELYTTVADDGAVGLGDLGDGDISLVDAYTRNTWRIEIKTAAGKSGTLVLPRPAKMTTRLIDLREKTEGGEPIVYKEFTFDGVVGSGSGLLKSGILGSTKYTLIFQGRGNMCHNAEDFTHWHLKVKGSRANYAFFGRMKSAN